jgi:hypothetical protein
MRAVGLGLLILFVASAGSNTYCAEGPNSRQPPPSSYREITLGYAAWSGLDSLEPAPVDFVAEQSGRFEERALGIEIAYHRRRTDHGKAVFLVGGELAGYGFQNKQSLVGYHAVTMEPATIRMEASWGQVTGSVRWVWREGEGTEFLVGAGAGAYLLRISETIDEFGVVERGEGDVSPGGYLLAGLRFPVRSGKMGFRTEVRIHGCSFSGIGGAFEGQKVSGPVTVFNFGMDF